MGVVYVEKAMYDEGIEALQKSVGASGNRSGAVGILGWAYARAGRIEEALQQLEQLRQRSKEENIPAYHFFLVHFGLGETDKALDLLEQAYEERTPELINVYTWPLVDALRAEPRFIEVMTKVGVLQQ